MVCLPFRRGAAHSEVGGIRGVTLFRESRPILDTSKGALTAYLMGGTFTDQFILVEIERVLREKKII